MPRFESTKRSRPCALGSRGDGSVAHRAGVLAGARSPLRAAEAHIDPDVLTATFALGEDLYWVLDDEQQRRVLALPPSAGRGWTPGRGAGWRCRPARCRAPRSRPQ